MKKGSKVAKVKEFVSTSLVSKRTSTESTKECNLARLAKSGILNNFVASNKGLWDHEKWLNLCDEISKQDLTPIDYDQVGIILEKNKADYFNKQ